MGTIRDYINWRNENGPDELNLKEISDIYFEKIFDKKEFREGSVLKDGPEILKMISNTDRYRNVRVRNYVSLNDTERTLQFAAMEFMLSDNTSYIAFRGTDDTVVGWKEDFMLAMMETEAEKETASGKDIKAILPKLVSIIPEEAVVGLLMNPVGTPVVVKSIAFALRQHNPATWCLEGKSLVTTAGVSKGATAFRRLIKESLGKMSREELDEFVENLFSVFENAGALTLTDFKKGGFKSLKSIAHAIGERRSDENG